MANSNASRIKGTIALAGGRAFFVPSGFIGSVKMTSVIVQIRNKSEAYPTKSGSEISRHNALMSQFKSVSKFFTKTTSTKFFA
jgi:hypothetical protein